MEQKIRKQKIRTMIIVSLCAITLFVSAIASLRLSNLTIPHALLHTVGLIFASFMIFTSISAYVRTRSSRFLLLMLSFFMFGVMEGINFAYATSIVRYPTVPDLNIEISHIFGVSVLSMFAMSTLKE